MTTALAWFILQNSSLIIVLRCLPAGVALIAAPGAASTDQGSTWKFVDSAQRVVCSTILIATQVEQIFSLLAAAPFNSWRL